MEAQRPSELTPYRALYSFVARNADELSVDAGGLIEVRDTLQMFESNIHTFNHEGREPPEAPAHNIIPVLRTPYCELLPANVAVSQHLFFQTRGYISSFQSLLFTQIIYIPV